MEKNKKLEVEVKCVDGDKARLMRWLQFALEKLDACRVKVVQKNVSIAAIGKELKHCTKVLNYSQKKFAILNDKVKGQQIETKRTDDTISTSKEDLKY
jgi:septal ring factor EnvC (AmiA/AmiB activator)